MSAITTMLAKLQGSTQRGAHRVRGGAVHASESAAFGRRCRLATPRRILLVPMRSATIIVPLLLVTIAVAPLHEAIDGATHGRDPQGPTRSP